MQRAPHTAEPTLPFESGGFLIVEELGRGGMGVVYRAEESASGRVVALKVLAHDLAVSSEAFQRFQREARIAAAISHAHCVFVYGAHEFDGAPAIAMELCTGETLQERLQRGEAVPIADAVRWTMQILDGLAAAHEAGILHRDVKPSNCFLTESGDVKVGDFGLSKALESDIGLTRSGAYLGSPLYSSPEQARGRTLDLRSDLYSVGATLYALLSGRAPYTGTNVGEVLARIMTEEPEPLRTLRPEVPRALEKVVLKAMSRKPEDRFRDHAAFRQALEPFVEQSTPAGPVRRVLAYVIDFWFGMGLLTTFLMGVGQGLDLDLLHFHARRNYLFEHWQVYLVLGSLPILYAGLAEGLAGCTLGKWLLGLRIVSEHDRQPSLPRAFARAFLFFGTGFLVPLFLHAVDVDALEPDALFKPGQAVLMVVSPLWMLALLSTARRRNGWRCLHEKWSGTVALQRPSPFQRFRPEREVGEASLRSGEDFPAHVGRLEVEGVLGRTPEGRLLVARDPDLHRTVWIHERALPATQLDESRRTLDRPTRIRWLAQAFDGATCFDVFEAPGGRGLAEHVRSDTALAWQQTSRLLLALVDELCCTEHEPAERRFDLAQTWIDRTWSLRLIDFALEDGAPRGPQRLGRLELLAALATQLAPRDRSGAARLPEDLPFHAEPALRRLLGLDAPFASFEEARAALDGWRRKPSAVQRPLRIAQVIMATAFPAFVAMSGVVGGLMAFKFLADIGDGMSAAKDLGRHETAIASAEPPSPATGEAAERPHELDAEGVRARRILIADALGTAWGPALEQQLRGRERELVREVRDEQLAFTPDELTWARERVKGAQGGRSIGENLDLIVALIISFTFLLASAGIGMVTLVAALIMRFGPSFRATGLRLRTRRGVQASRLRCALRSVVTWVPSACLFAAAAVYGIAFERSTLPLVLSGIGALVFLAGFLFSLLSRGPSLQDRVARTRIVPL